MNAGPWPTFQQMNKTFSRNENMLQVPERELLIKPTQSHIENPNRYGHTPDLSHFSSPAVDTTKNNNPKITCLAVDLF